MVAQSDRCQFHFGWRSLVPQCDESHMLPSLGALASPTGLSGKSFLL
jgi:hypothetical protein